MKKIALLGIVFMSALSWAQTNVTLKINHLLGTETFAIGAEATNNLDQAFKTSRLEYYISKFTIVHDGGTITDVPLEVIELVKPGEESSTSIELGSFDVTDVESIRFHIGVYEPVNNDDPTLWPEDHPLAPQSPSMHWGWTAGYRFLAYEGESGTGFSQIFQLHGLGNDNYFKTETDVEVETIDGGLVLNVDADYTEGLRDIDISGGTISHGEIGNAKKALENFRDYVFGSNVASLPTETTLNWNVYPNPSTTGQVTVQFNQPEEFTLKISNALGQTIEQIAVNGKSSIDLNLPEAGIYMVSVLKEEKVIATNRLVVD